MEEKNSKKKERKMRDSGIPWIGEVPEGWGMSPLKYNYNILAGATPDSTKDVYKRQPLYWISRYYQKKNRMLQTTSLTFSAAF